MTQPIPLAAPVQDEESAHRERRLRRAVALLLNQSARYIYAQAHGDSDTEAEEFDRLQAIEDDLRARHRRIWGRDLEPRLHQLLLQLEHSNPHTTAADCLTCRRLTSHAPVIVEEFLHGTLA